MLVVACTSQQATSAITVTDAKSVENCQLLTSVTESQYSGLLFAGAGLAEAQKEVMAKAASAGATHIVWGALNSGGVVQSATASAYRCS
jgi:hypothetical protein